ncbi:MAG: cell envelope integrity protein TolA [Gammaproteobacteria bacterium]|nr:cell envelope integrity protein TolA [Gammaproteobacteria bacterium]
MVVTQAIRISHDHPEGGIKPFAYSLAIHLMIVALVGLSFHWSASNQILPQHIIKAVIVEQGATEPPKEEKKTEEVKPKEDSKQKKIEQEKARELEKKKQTLAEEKKRKALEVKKKQEAEKRRKQAEQSLQEMLQQEEAEAQQAAKAAQAASLVDQYKVAIRQKVSRNWVRPPAARSGLQCMVRVRLVPSGEVLEAKVVRSSGDTVFDRSVENAVYKAAPLPIPQDTELFDFFREIEFLFSPED